MAHVIVVEHPGYAAVYRTFGQDGHNDRLTLDQGEGWARYVDEHADSVATPAYLAEGTQPSPHRPLAHQGNRVAHCVVPLPAAWAGRVPAYLRQGLPQTQRPLTAQELDANFRRTNRGVRDQIVAETLSTYQRAARWSRPHGVVSILVGHGSTHVGFHGHPGLVTLDLAPACAAQSSTRMLRQLETRVRELRRQGLSFREVAEQDWESHDKFVLQTGVAFRAARVRRIDMMVCQTGIGPQGRIFLNRLARLWGAQVRGMRGSSRFGQDGTWYVDFPTRLPAPPGTRPRALRLSDKFAGYLGTSAKTPGPMPGYPPDSMFGSSDGSATPL